MRILDDSHKGYFNNIIEAVSSLVSAFVIIDIYLVIGVYFRFGKDSGTNDASEKGKRSTSYIVLLSVLNIVILLTSLIFDEEDAIKLFYNPQTAFWGNLVMVVGFFIRVNSVWTLKEFYTKTLVVQPNQKIIESGFYKTIRHPGYLGSILLWMGAGVSSNNFIVLILLTLSSVLVYHYRMKNEEKMLLEAFGNEYFDYIRRTRRLIPLIY